MRRRHGPLSVILCHSKVLREVRIFEMPCESRTKWPWRMWPVLSAITHRNDCGLELNGVKTDRQSNTMIRRKGKIVRAEGKVTLYRERPEIKFSGPDANRIVEMK